MELVQKLSEAFIRTTMTAQKDDDAAAIAAGECLVALQTLLDAVKQLPGLYPAIEKTLLPLLVRLLQPNMFGITTSTTTTTTTITIITIIANRL